MTAIMNAKMCQSEGTIVDQQTTTCTVETKKAPGSERVLGGLRTSSFFRELFLSASFDSSVAQLASTCRASWFPPHLALGVVDGAFARFNKHLFRRRVDCDGRKIGARFRSSQFRFSRFSIFLNFVF